MARCHVRCVGKFIGLRDNSDRVRRKTVRGSKLQYAHEACRRKRLLRCSDLSVISMSNPSDLRQITERRLASSQPKSDEIVFRRISLNPVGRTNAAYHASWPRSEVERYQALASGSRILWSDRMFRATLNTSTFQNITQIVRILPPLLAWIGTSLYVQNPSVLTTRATRKTTRISVRDAKYNAAFRHAPSQHGRYRRPKQLARNAKTPRKTFGFAAERTGTEQPTNSLVIRNVRILAVQIPVHFSKHLRI